MSYGLPPIVKKAEGLMAEIELAVTRFPRRFRYCVGVRLSEEAMYVALAAHQAWRESQSDAPLIELATAIDRLKLRMQLAQQVHAFSSFGQFEALARVVSDLGKQCGGWQKKRISKRQNGQEPSPVQRPQILSSRAASSEAQP